MDRYFYSVWTDGKDNKLVHMCGNIYFNDADETETNYRCAEWTGMSFTLKELAEEINSRNLFDELCENIRYLEDITKEEALKIADSYFGDEIIIHLPIHCVSQYTPCGYYWFEGDEMYGE
jgi:phospholipase C